MRDLSAIHDSIDACGLANLIVGEALTIFSSTAK
jgi:hypothetical protein